MSQRTSSKVRVSIAAALGLACVAQSLTGCGNSGDDEEKDSVFSALLTQPALHRIGALRESPAMVKASTVSPSVGTAAVAALPAAVDLSSKLPPVGDQGAQSSCVGWAVAYSTKTLQEVVEVKWPPNATDHEFSASWIYNQINGGIDNGSHVSDALNLVVSKGADTVSSFPYNQSDFTTQPGVASLARAAHYKAQSWSMSSVSTQNLKTTLAGGNAIIVAFEVLPDMDDMNGTTNTIYDTDAGTRPPGCTVAPCSRGGHAVTLVGYDDAVAAFRFVNQWGKTWNGNGFGWLAYSFVTNANLGLQAFVMVDKANVPGLQDSTMTWEETAPLLLI